MIFKYRSENRKIIQKSLRAVLCTCLFTFCVILPFCLSTGAKKIFPAIVSVNSRTLYLICMLLCLSFLLSVANWPNIRPQN
jgi:hypothetical protein